MTRVLPVLFLVVLGIVLAPAAQAGALDDGKEALAAGDYAAAAEAFEKVLKKSPTDPDAAIGLARARIGAGDPDAFVGAEETLLDTREAHPKRADVKIALGDLYLAMAKTKISNPQAMKFILEDAKATFQAVLDADPSNEDAAVGVARSLYESADFAGAIGVLDAFLAETKGEGKAWYWKGQTWYLQALDAYRNAGQLDENVKGLFRKAAGAYMTATKLDPQTFDAWMQLGYAHQYLGETASAREAYEKAMDLDPQSMMPLKGIEALFYYEQEKYPAALKELATSHPDNVALDFFVGFNALQRKDWSEALRAFRAFEKEAKTPAFVWVHMAKAYEGQGDAANARKHFRKALEANPDDVVAADGIDRALRAEHGQGAATSAQAALAMAKAYDELFELAPNNVWVRNNVAFILREAVTPHQGQGAWRPVLDACVEIYEDASRLVERQITGREGTTPYTTRHSYAGVLNDTGLMYQYYPAIQDLQKAEDYYLRALDITQDGYFDAFNNLEKIYRGQGRTDDLRELAAAAAEGLKQPDGSDNATGRAYARGVLQKLGS